MTASRSISFLFVGIRTHRIFYVRVFGLLKRAYGQEIKMLMKYHINHITKLEFFIAFKAAFTSILEEKTLGWIQRSWLTAF